MRRVFVLASILMLLMTPEASSEKLKPSGVTRATLGQAKALVIKSPRRDLAVRVTKRAAIRRVIRTLSYQKKRRCKCRIKYVLDFELEGGRHVEIEAFPDYWAFADDRVARHARRLERALDRLFRPEQRRVAIAGLAAKAAETRRRAVSSLASLGAYAAVAVPALIKMLENDPDISLRAHVANSLALIPRPARKIEAALERASKSPEAEVRRVARESLQFIAAEKKRRRRRGATRRSR